VNQSTDHSLLDALEREYDKQQHIYQIAKRNRVDSAVLTTLAVMNTIRRVLDRAGLDRFAEVEPGKRPVFIEEEGD
jgi:hypothetical protein